jgi:hypothetical protein
MAIDARMANAKRMMTPCTATIDGVKACMSEWFMGLRGVKGNLEQCAVVESGAEQNCSPEAQGRRRRCGSPGSGSLNLTALIFWEARRGFNRSPTEDRLRRSHLRTPPTEHMARPESLDLVRPCQAELAPKRKAAPDGWRGWWGWHSVSS